MNNIQVLQTTKSELLMELRNIVKDELRIYNPETPEEKRKNLLQNEQTVYLTREEASDMLHISKVTLHRIINDGLLDIVKIRRRTMIPLESIKKYLEANTSKGVN